MKGKHLIGMCELCSERFCKRCSDADDPLKNCSRGCEIKHEYRDEKIVRAVLSLDGDHACALVGANLQDGEAEFEKLDYEVHESRYQCERSACFKALTRLRERLGIEITYAMGAGMSV